MREGEIRVQVCFADGKTVFLEPLDVVVGTTLREAIALTGLRNRAGVDLSGCRFGIYGKLKSEDVVLRDRDRIEIYRPLRADPKEARRRRAKKKAG